MNQDKKQQVMRVNTSRRKFFAGASGAIGAALLINALPRTARADDLPHLTSADPTAQALGYVDDSTKVDAAKFPTHVAGAACGNCNFYQGASAAYGPCPLFAGKDVNIKGWCSAYAKKA